jgi:hypothetical protein
VNAAELSRAMLDAKTDCDAAHAWHEECVEEAAKAEHAYRLAKATTILGVSGTVQEREAHMDQATADLRYKAQLYAGRERSALEKIKTTRQVLSMWQSLAASNRAEAQLATWTPREVESA